VVVAHTLAAQEAEKKTAAEAQAQAAANLRTREPMNP
jgi:hypothetical protein